MRHVLTVLMVFSLVKVDVTAKPAWESWGREENVHYDAQRRVYVDTNVCWDNWMMGADPQLVYDLTHPREIPVKSVVVLSLRNDLFRNEETYLYAGVVTVTSKRPAERRRLVLISVEESVNELRGCLETPLPVAYAHHPSVVPTCNRNIHKHECHTPPT